MEVFAQYWIWRNLVKESPSGKLLNWPSQGFVAARKRVGYRSSVRGGTTICRSRTEGLIQRSHGQAYGRPDFAVAAHPCPLFVMRIWFSWWKMETISRVFQKLMTQNGYADLYNSQFWRNGVTTRYKARKMQSMESLAVRPCPQENLSFTALRRVQTSCNGKHSALPLRLT